MEKSRIVVTLDAQSIHTSNASKMLAQAKSLRQDDNPEGRDDLYEYTKPEQPIEYIAARRIEDLESKLEKARLTLQAYIDAFDQATGTIHVAERVRETLAFIKD